MYPYMPGNITELGGDGWLMQVLVVHTGLGGGCHAGNRQGDLGWNFQSFVRCKLNFLPGKMGGICQKSLGGLRFS